MGEHDGEGHHLGCLVGSIAEPAQVSADLDDRLAIWGHGEMHYSHDALVSSADVLQSSVVQTSRDFWALLLNRNKHVAGLVVEALLRRVITNLLDRLAHDLLVVDLGFGSDFAKHLSWSAHKLEIRGVVELTMIMPVLAAVSHAT